MKTQTMRVVGDQSADTLSEIRNDLESALGKIEAFAGLLARLTDDTDLAMFSLQYSAEFIAEEFKGVFDRLLTFERAQVRP
jgi:hypothetical protein